MFKRKNAVLGLFLAVGFIAAAWLLGWHFKEAKRIANASGNTIRVKGYAKKNIESDLAEWKGMIKARYKNLPKAYDLLNRYKTKTLSYLRSQGIEDSIINISTVTTKEIYKKSSKGYGVTNEIEAYELTQQISFQSEDLNKVEEISRESSELIEQRVNFKSFPASFYYTKIESLKLKMLSKASKNAYERAKQLAGNTGSEVGPLQSASQGVFQITPRNSTEVSNYGSFDTKSKLKSIKAVITAEFSVE